MTTFHTIIFVLFTLLWLGLAYIILDLGGVTLYNILVRRHNIASVVETLAYAQRLVVNTRLKYICLTRLLKIA